MLAFVSSYRKSAGWFVPLPRIGAYSILRRYLFAEEGGLYPTKQVTVCVAKRGAEEGETGSIPWGILHWDLGY